MSIVLLPSYSLNSDGDLVVKDKTSSYTSINVGGWDATGGSNPRVTDALTAEVRIAKRNTDGTFQTETTVNVYSDLPSDVAGEKIITPEDADQSFSDAVYRFTYIVSGSWLTVPFLVQDVRYIPLIPSICSCYEKAEAEFVKCNCNCTDIAEKFRKISLYMRLLERAYFCKNIQAMSDFIDKLTQICECACCS